MVQVAADTVTNAVESNKDSQLVSPSKEGLSKWLEDPLTVLTFILVVLTLFLLILTYKLLRREPKVKLTSLWKFEVKSSGLKARTHFDITNFKDGFLAKKSFYIAKEKFVNEKKNLILVGRSGLGKTRSVFEILSNLEKNHEILTPFLARPEPFNSKSAFKKRKKVILFIDDLQNYNTTDINYYLENLMSNSDEVQLLCTWKIGNELDIFSSFQIPNLERFSLDAWTETEGKALATLLDIDFDVKAFDHTPASVIYKLQKLKEQYKQLSENQKAILESIKLLRTIRLDCNSDLIKEVAEKVFDLDQAKLTDKGWETEFNNLKKMGFYDLRDDGEVIINDIYLSELIELDFNSAFKRYFKFVKERGYSLALFYSGLYFERKRDFDRAEECYKEAIAIFPRYGSSYYRLGSLYFWKARDQERSMDFNLAKQSIEKSIKYFVSAVKVMLKPKIMLKPIDYSYYLAVGRAYARAAGISEKLDDNMSKVQNFIAAIQNFTKAIDLNSERHSERPGPYLERGLSNFLLERYDDALSDYNFSKGLNDSIPNLYLYLGLLFYEKNEVEKALQNYRHCIGLKPDYYQAYNNIGHILSKKLKNSDLSISKREEIASEAIKNFLLAIWHSRGRYFVAYANLGHVYLESKKFKKGIKALNIVIKKSPKYGEAYASRAYAYNHVGKYELAESDLLKALKFQPQTALENNIIQSLAFCYQNMGTEKRDKGEKEIANKIFLKAIHYYDKLETVKDEDLKTSAQQGKAITLERMGNKSEAFEIFIKLFSDNPSNTKVLDSICKHLEYLKNPEDDNDKQILSFFSILLEAVKQNRIESINKPLMEQATLQIQRLSKLKKFSSDFQEMTELFKKGFPKDYRVFKTSGVFNLNSGIVEEDFDKKMKYLSEAETDFHYAQSLSKKTNRVFVKHLSVVNSNMCAALKERFAKTNKREDLCKYNELIEITKNMFVESEKIFPDYPELWTEHSIFLYCNGFTEEANVADEQAVYLYDDQLARGTTTQKEIENDLKELEEVKSRLGIT